MDDDLNPKMKVKASKDSFLQPMIPMPLSLG
jgi:hypothetical protein